MKSTISLLLLCALKSEAKGVIKRLTLSPEPFSRNYLIYQGTTTDVDINLLITGVNYEWSENAVKNLMREKNYHLLINFGTAGALIKDLFSRSVFLPELFFNEDNEKVIISSELFPVIEGICQEVGFPVRRGGIFTSRVPIRRKRKRGEIAEKFGVQAVDMEVFPQAKVAQENGLPFLGIKVISDNAGISARWQYQWNVSRISIILGEIMGNLVERRAFK